MTITAAEDFRIQGSVIDDLIKNDQLDRATLGLLDFVQRWPRIPADLRNHATALSARWTRLNTRRRQLGDTPQIEYDLRELTMDLLAALNDIARWADSSRDAATVATVASQGETGVTRRPGFVSDFLSRRQSAAYRDSSVRRAGDVAFACDGIELRYRNGSAANFCLACDHLELRFGELTAVVGANAAGKTTLLRMIAGEIAPETGKLSYPCVPGRAAQDWYDIRQNIAYMPQSMTPWKGLMIDHLRFEAAAHGHRGEENDLYVTYMIHRLRLEEHADKTWEQLSGGYRTRFALARALLSDPQILVLDEPLAFLDPVAAVGFLQDLNDLARWPEKPIAVIISSQHLHEIETLASQVLFTEAGKVHVGSAAPNAGEPDANVFEIRCSVTAEELRAVLGTLGPLHVAETPLYYSVTMSPNVSCGEALQRILSASIVVRYFRDITQSAKRRLK